MKKLTTFKPEFIEKRWGGELWIANDSCHDYCGKILYIKKGESTSMHFHGKKHETFYVLEGTLEVKFIDTETGEEETVRATHGESMKMPTVTPHKLSAPIDDVKLIESSTYHMDSDSYRVYL